MALLPIHLNPVNVSWKWKPSWAAMDARTCDDTVEFTNHTLDKSSLGVSSITYIANKNPISLPLNCFQLPEHFTATLNRSASGSLATTKSTPCLSASAMAKSNAPFSSGLGNLTVLKLGSGLAWAGVEIILSRAPKSARAFSKISPPTP